MNELRKIERSNCSNFTDERSDGDEKVEHFEEESAVDTPFSR